ncbi:unnamed protein product [Chrysoparadoxa australica]
MAYMSHVGAHCSLSGCNQRDFLPFECDCCQQVFCLTHRTYKEHDCPKSAGKDMQAISCPLCSKTIKLTGDQDANAVWAAHSATDCQPHTSAKPKPKKKRCPVSGCKEKLGPTNTTQCTRCHMKLCLTHRYPDAHACMRSGSWTAKAKGGKANPKAMPKPRATAQAQGSEDNTLLGTAFRRAQGMAASATAAVTAAATATETCQQCGKGFSDVGALISHVESAHNGGAVDLTQSGTVGSGSGSGSGGCPFCGRTFSSSAELVSHVERAHQEGQQVSQCMDRPCSASNTALDSPLKNVQ